MERFVKGEVVVFPFPYTNLSETKKRPALVISSLDFNSKSDDLICCLITSNPEETQHAIKITNKDMESGHLEFESKIKPYRLFTINKSLVYKFLGRLNLAKSKIIIDEINEIINIK